MRSTLLTPTRLIKATRKLRLLTASLCLLSSLLCASTAMANPYFGLKTGLASPGGGSNWNIAGSLDLGYTLQKYFAAEAVYGKYSEDSNLVLAQGKLMLPLSNVLSGTGMTLFASLGGGWVGENSGHGIAATYGLGAMSSIVPKVNLSFSWQHVNKTSKTGSYDFLGIGADFHLT